MARFWPDGDPITMQTARRDIPQAFLWRERRHRVRLIANQWRVDRDWYTRRVWRHYYRLVTDTGLLVEVYHDLVTDDWCVQRLYD